ncbi:probable LRR receptor-like protein kinase At1g51890 isoform X2 [Typha latifolia]|uniref:probable LRR receptor-like protein kinase At1g51890 isoform X2 n=1 Tax=Typha latifolia TaxID=4733 RepID=UPI003C2C3C48
MYGNYDGKNSLRNNIPLLFDLYIGVNLWKTVNISDPSSRFTYEAITVTLGDFVSVCLIRTGSWIPFISLLELRPLKSTLYPAASSSSNIVFSARRNFGEKTDKIIRYPDDPHDRIWKPLTNTANLISTTSIVRNYQTDLFEAPSAVMQTATTTAGINDTIEFYWDSEISNVGPYYYANLFICELEDLSGKDVREIDIYVGGVLWFEHFRPPYLMSAYVYSISELEHLDRYQFTLKVSKNSTRPPIINAVEVYSLQTIGDAAMTNIGDAEAMLAIKAGYKVKKNWAGDPCAPKQYVWDGVTCSNGGSDSRIIALNLSSSGLVGLVSTSFSSLTAITSLDLSYNNLSGKIPDSLADISSLHVLNLTGNCITEIPESLKKKESLTLRFDNNSDTCNGSNSPTGDSPTPATKKKLTTTIIIVISVVPAILLVVLVLIVWRIIRKHPAGNHEVVQAPSETRQFNVDHGGNQMSPGNHQFNLDHKDSQLPSESRQFMYTELENITKKFSHTLGKGGFGTVFHGSLEDGIEVAVKMCSLSSEQAPTFFLAEVENLSKVRHKNLVSLVGYCTDRGCMAVVYEYMPLGSLEDHLTGKAGNSRALSWAERLQIVLDAAQGLDYLYNGCPTPIIHRDIKSSNILLGKNLEAKVSDFGLSKAFHSDLQTHVSMTALAFSPGYIDPMRTSYTSCG